VSADFRFVRFGRVPVEELIFCARMY